jgi:putative tricarboxylic transport membrane protein
VRAQGLVGLRLRAVLPYVVVLVLAGGLFHLASGFTYARSGDRLGPEVWPRAILLLTIVTCVVRIVRLLWQRGDAAVPGHAVTPEDEAVGEARDVERAGDAMPAEATLEAAEADVPLSPLRLLAGIAATVLYVLLLPVLGFALDTAVFIAAMCRIGNYRRWRVILPTAIVGSLAFMFVFQRIVYVSLPIGTPPFDALALALMRLMGIR